MNNRPTGRIAGRPVRRFAAAPYTLCPKPRPICPVDFAAGCQYNRTCQPLYNLRGIFLLNQLWNTLRTQFFDAKLIKFVAVGVVNTLVGMAIMFGLYNLAGCSYWISSAANYILTSILSYILNKTFTFGNKDSVGSTALRFAVNIAVCYLLAYGIAKPLTGWLLAGASVSLRDNCSMLVGMVLFTALNYIGQRFFAFRPHAS